MKIGNGKNAATVEILIVNKELGGFIAKQYEGAQFDQHTHLSCDGEYCHEVIFIHEGLAKVYFDGELEATLGPGEGIYIPKGQKHSFEYDENTKMFVVIVPCDQDFINGG